MKSAPLAPNEPQRLEALRQTGILDTAPEECFDRLTDLAAQLCGAPIALITLVDVDRQWFKSNVGLTVGETPRDVAFCAHAILQPDILVVRDALADARFASNPLVTSEPKIRFYAGSPLVTHDGNALGTLCVIDTVPRELDLAQTEALRSLAAHATTLLDLRRSKALIQAHAERWEHAVEAGDSATRSDTLARLGEDLRGLIEAREQAESSFRALERNLQRIAPQRAPSAEDAAREVERLLREILESAERLSSRLGSEHPQRAEAIRVGAFATRALELHGARGARARAMPTD